MKGRPLLPRPLPFYLTWNLIVLTLLLSYSYRSTAKEYSYINFTAAQGLAGAVVYSIVQDKDGFMWIGTGTGLSRFDGTRFKNYTIADGLPSNEVLDFFIDRKNRIWLNVFARELAYYYQGKIYNNKNDSFLRQIPVSSDQKGYAEDKSGNILICISNGAVYIPAGKGQVRIYPSAYNGKGFFDPVQSHGTIQGKFIVPEQHYLLGRYYANRAYNDILRIDNQALFLEKNGQGRVNMVIVKPDGQRLFFRQDDVNTLGELNNDSTVLLNQVHGAYVYSLRHYTCIDTLLYGVGVNVSFRDKEGGLWLGSNGQGLFYFPPNPGVSIRPSLGNSLPVQVNHFNKYDDKIWISSSNWHFWELDVRNKFLGKKIPRAAIDGNRLARQFKGNIFHITPRGIYPVLLKEYKEYKEYKFWGNVKSLSGSGDTLAAVTNTLAGRMVLPGQILERFQLPGKRLTCTMYERGWYYVGTLEGMYIRSGSHDTSPMKPVIPGVIVSMCYSYKSDLIWVITANDGLYCLQNNQIIRHLDVSSGLSSNICKCIFTDGEKVYVGTVDGLNVIDPSRRFAIKTYYTLDGLLSNDINCVYAEGSNLIAGTSEGVSFLDMVHITNTAACNLVLNDIYISRKKIVPNGMPVALAPEDNNIEFSYSGISFRSMGRIRYTYRLKGLDDRWMSTDQDYLKYPSLPSGAYTLELYARNRFNQKSNLISFSFVIGKHWWEYWWLQFPAALILIGGIFIVIFWRNRHKRKIQREKLALKEKIIELEQLALRSQMNPHFIFNSLNSFYQYVITKDLEGASEFMSNFSRLIRLLFETTSSTSVTLDKEIEFLTYYLKMERTKHNSIFNFHFKIQDGIHPEEITIPTFILQPFLENSIKHGIQNRNDSDGYIEVSISSTGAAILVTISDNGVGRAYTQAQKEKFIKVHDSKGLPLTRKRLELYNKIQRTDIQFKIIDQYQEGVPSGTLVIVDFPLKDVYDKDHFN